MGTPGDYHEYTGGIPRCMWEVIMSTPEGYHEYTFSKVHSLSSGKVEMYLCASCHTFTLHVNVWKNRIGIVVQV